MTNKHKYDKLVINSKLKDDAGKFYMITMLVADFGGGTSDFSKLELNGSIGDDDEEVSWRFVGTAISGIQQFGGQDITTTIEKDLIKQIMEAMGESKKNELDEEDQNIIKCEISEMAETAKKRLSCRKVWKNQYRWNRNKYDVNMSQARLKHLNKDHITLIEKRVKECIQDDQIDQLLMVGGTSEVLFIKETLKELVGPDCIIEVVRQGRDMIGYGAAYIGQIIANKDLKIQFQQINAFDLGVGLSKGRMLHLITKGCSIPFSRTDSKVYSNTQRANNITINVYEGNSEFTQENVRIGEIKIKYDRYYEKEEHKVRISASLNNNGLLQICVYKSDGNETIGKFERHLGIQTNLISTEMKQRIKAQKDANAHRLYIENLEDDFEEIIMELLDTNNVDKQKINEFRSLARECRTVKEWSTLIEEAEDYYEKVTNAKNKNVSGTKNKPITLKNENDGNINHIYF